MEVQYIKKGEKVEILNIRGAYKYRLSIHHGKEKNTYLETQGEGAFANFEELYRYREKTLLIFFRYQESVRLIYRGCFFRMFDCTCSSYILAAV